MLTTTSAETVTIAAWPVMYTDALLAKAPRDSLTENAFQRPVKTAAENPF